MHFVIAIELYCTRTICSSIVNLMVFVFSSQFLSMQIFRILFVQEPLKGLSHEIDFKTFDKNLLGLTKGRGWFLNFLQAPMILKCKKYIYCG